MTGLLTFVALIGLWFFLQAWLLPKLGFNT